MSEVRDLSSMDGATIAANLPLGLPEMAWWLVAILAGCFAVYRLSRRWQWLKERIDEPSTHVATACFLGFSGLFIDSLTIDPAPLGQALLLAAAIFAFLGLIGKDREGPLL